MQKPGSLPGILLVTLSRKEKGFDAPPRLNASSMFDKQQKTPKGGGKEGSNKGLCFLNVNAERTSENGKVYIFAEVFYLQYNPFYLLVCECEEVNLNRQLRT